MYMILINSRRKLRKIEIKYKFSEKTTHTICFMNLIILRYQERWKKHY